MFLRENNDSLLEEKALANPKTFYHYVTWQEAASNPEYKQLVKSVFEDNWIRIVQHHYRKKHDKEFKGKFTETVTHSIPKKLPVRFIKEVISLKYIEHADKINSNKWTLLDFKDPEFVRNIAKALRVGLISLDRMVTAKFLYDAQIQFKNETMSVIKQYSCNDEGVAEGIWDPKTIPYATKNHLATFQEHLKKLEVVDKQYFVINFPLKLELAFFWDWLERKKMGFDNPFFIKLLEKFITFRINWNDEYQLFLLKTDLELNGIENIPDSLEDFKNFCINAINKLKISSTDRPQYTDLNERLIDKLSSGDLYIHLTKAIFKFGIKENLLPILQELPTHAILIKDNEMLETLAKMGINLNQKIENKWYPLHTAVFQKNSQAVRVMLNPEYKVNLDQMEQHNVTAAYLAAQKNDPEILKSLAEAGADLTIATDKGYSPLHIATEIGSIDLIKILTDPKYKVDINAKLVNAQLTPLHMASIEGNTEIVEILINCPAINILQTDNLGKHAIHYAMNNKHWQIASLLISKINFKSLNVEDQKLIVSHENELRQFKREISSPQRAFSLFPSKDISSKEELALQHKNCLYINIMMISNHFKL